MGAFENIEQLKTILTECKNEINRVWHMPYNPSDEKQIRYRYNAYCIQIEKLEDVAEDLIDFCKDFIANSPEVGYEFYRDKVFDNLNYIYEGKERITPWYRSCALLLCYYDEVKIYEREEAEGICQYHYENTGRGEFVTRRTFSNGILWTNYGKIDHGSYQTLLEYCKLRESFEYRLLSLLCHYKESKKGNVNIDYTRQMIVFAHTVCLYTVMHNEIKPLLKDARYAGLNPDELRNTPTPPSKEDKVKKTKQPREVFTERAKKYFAKAEKAGYLKKVGNKYEWLYRGGTVALVYFFIRIYEPKSPPFKQLQPLFGVEGLTSSRRNLEKTDWYKDEMERQKMSQEELARERRERNLKEPKEWFLELKCFFED